MDPTRFRSARRAL